MRRTYLVLLREISHQWHSITGFVAALFFAFLLIFISGYAYNYVQSLPDFSDVAVIFCLIFSISTQFSVSFLGIRSTSFVNELKILPVSGSNIFICRIIAIFAGITLINLISVPAFIVFFNFDTTYISVFKLFFVVVSVSIAQISLGLITQFGYTAGSKYLSNYALILTLPLLFPIFTAKINIVKDILSNGNANLSGIMIIFGLDILYFVSGLVIFEITNRK